MSLGPTVDRRLLLLGAPLYFGGAAMAAAKTTALRTDLGTSTADLDGMMKRRVIRMLVPYSRTLFFQDRGALHGTAVEAAQLLEAWLNKTLKTGHRPVVTALIPTTRDVLLDELLAGRGDIALGDVTVTEERAKRVAFTRPVLPGVKEILITPKAAPPLADANALSGTTVAARAGTSMYASLQTLNQRLAAAGKPPVQIELVPGALEVEDMIEMVAAGLLPAIVADDWIARLWITLVPGVAAQPQVVLRDGVQIAWAVRPGNPKLLAVLNRAIAAVGGNATALTRRTAIYLQKLKHIHNAGSDADIEQFRDLRKLFEQYGQQYGFDALLLEAQGYQESRLRQEARSRAGAIGLMQLMPATGALMNVGDIKHSDANVHAGAKYVRQLIDTYFPDASFDEQNRTLFAFASYNAGPTAIVRMRNLTKKQKLNPDVWLNNVERITAARIGQQPVRYVRNIYKYYIAYKLIEAHQKTLDTMKTPKHD